MKVKFIKKLIIIMDKLKQRLNLQEEKETIFDYIS